MLEQLPSFRTFLAARSANGSEPLELYTAVAAELNKIGSHEAKGRASFIRDQCAGFDGKAIFQKYRGRWDIPAFADDLVNLSDFSRGFLFRFRDHDASWKDAAAARDWFLNSVEARSARRYERWSRDAGYPQCIGAIEGSYEELCAALRAAHT